MEQLLEVKTKSQKGLEILMKIARKEGYLIGAKEGRNLSPEAFTLLIETIENHITNLKAEFDSIIPKT